MNGETAFPKPIILADGVDLPLPSRDEGRSINCRVMQPSSCTKPKGVYLHIHAGGWVLMNEHFQDSWLRFLADCEDMVVISAGYRLAPEHPYPAAVQDCSDIAEWLVDHAVEEFGSPLRFMGGESAGAHLSMLTALQLLNTRKDFRLSGLVLTSGIYDLSFLPSCLPKYQPKPLPVLTPEMMARYRDAFIPLLLQQKYPPILKSLAVSPFYADLRGSNLPPALFLCGTEDCLLDDSVMMATKWTMAGADAVLKLVPGAPHAFVLFPLESVECAKEGREIVKAFLRENF